MKRDATYFGCVPFLYRCRYMRRLLADECQRPEDVSRAVAEEVAVPFTMV